MEITLISLNDVIYDYGIRSLSAFFKKHNYIVNLVFLNVNNEQLSWKILQKLLEICSKSLFVGCSLLTHSLQKAITVTKTLKQFNPTVPIVWGGIHPSSAPKECLKFADIVCIGEGEDTILEIAQNITRRKRLTQIQNTYYKDQDGKIVKNPVRPLVQNLDSLPYPDYSLENEYVTHNDDLVKSDFYLFKSKMLYYPFAKMGYVYITMTSRGCPYDCTFCCNNILRKLYAEKGIFTRKRSAGNVIDEIRHIKEQFPFITLILFEDDSFLLRSFEEIREFSMAYKNQIDIPFGIEVFPNEISDEKIGVLKDAGLKLVHMGIQSGDSRIRKTIYHRNTSDNAIMKANNILTEHKILHKYDIIVDTPFENDVKSSLRLLKKLRPYFSINLYSLRIYPNLEIGKLLKEQNYKQWLNANERLQSHSYLSISSEDRFTFVLQLYQRFPPNKTSFIIMHYIINTKAVLMLLKIPVVRKILCFVFREGKRERFKHIVRRFISSILIDARRWIMNKILKPQTPEWEYLPGGWQESVRERRVRGWDAEGIVRTLTKNQPSFIESITAPQPFSLSNEAVVKGKPDLNFHNNVMNFAYVLALASKGKNKISLLDWGGGIGQYYKIAKSLFPDIEINYTCKDMAKLCEAGKKLIPEAHFVTDEKDCLNQKYDLVMASVSLHYSKDWQRVFAQLIKCADQYIFVTRLPVIETKPSYVVIQRPYQYGYDTEYLGWCINKKEFMDVAQKSGAILERIFLCADADNIIIPNAPEQACYQGFLFKKYSQL